MTGEQRDRKAVRKCEEKRLERRKLLAEEPGPKNRREQRKRENQQALIEQEGIFDF